MLGLVLVVLEIGALLLAIYTMINVNAVCNDYQYFIIHVYQSRRHQSADNVQKIQTSDSEAVSQ